MPRKGWVLRRKIPGDPVYGSDLVQKFISSMMYDGKRATAQAIFYKAMDQVAKNDERRRVQTVQEGRRELQAGAGSEVAARGRRELSGSGGSEPLPQAIAGDSLAGSVFADSRRKDHDRQVGRRNYGRCERPRRRGEEEGGRAPHGGGQQGFRALSLVARIDFVDGTPSPNRSDPQHRDHGSH